ncbi:DUF998 domain-containing protein [Anaeropeptidivorans aminofermentans]|uniref:DUF998 domain-containing protein n=1 Tax=Anaeropeptidivorans aminofermentans TaxID=2934315 RepID=UPI002025513C|nr:DUF998 domain-containing protein [Anaeropeptidivorans aminofermentans]
MDLIIKYGWYALLIAIVGEMLIPILLAPFYKGYNHATMAISTLGNVNSPVRLPFNLWMLLAGILFLAATPAIYHAYYQVSKPLTTVSVLFIAVFAVGACIFTCFFSVNETKDMVTSSSKIHGAGSAIGFMLFLFVPLFMAILSFKTNDNITGTLSTISFMLALLFFILFIMADKPELQRTLVAKEGLWQRLNLLFMYLPLGYIAVRNIWGRI